MLVELLIRTHPVNLGGRGEDQPLAEPDAVADNPQILLEVKTEYPQGIADILDRGGDRHQGEDDITLADVVLDPLPVDGDITLDKMKPRLAEESADIAGVKVHPIDRVTPRGQEPLN